MGKRLSGLLLAAALVVGMQAGPAKADPSAAVLIGVAGAATVVAGTLLGAPQPDINTTMIGAGGGLFNALDQESEGIDGEFHIEARPALPLWRFNPIMGAFATTGGGFGGYIGLNHDWHVWRGLVLSVNVSPTLYSAGNGIHLGSYAVLRSGVELSYRFENAMRVTFGFHHMSHGEVFDDRNPGTETALLTVFMPLDSIWK